MKDRPGESISSTRVVVGMGRATLMRWGACWTLEVRVGVGRPPRSFHPFSIPSRPPCLRKRGLQVPDAGTGLDEPRTGSAVTLPIPITDNYNYQHITKTPSMKTAETSRREMKMVPVRHRGSSPGRPRARGGAPRETVGGCAPLFHVAGRVGNAKGWRGGVGESACFPVTAPFSVDRRSLDGTVGNSSHASAAARPFHPFCRSVGRFGNGRPLTHADTR